jgi:hypothetical protein
VLLRAKPAAVQKLLRSAFMTSTKAFWKSQGVIFFIVNTNVTS